MSGSFSSPSAPQARIGTLLRRFVAVLMFGMCMFAVAPATGQVPQILHYQATLTDGNFPATGPVDVEASFYPDTTSSSPLAGWSETWNAVPLENGRLSLYLGRTSPLPDALFEAPSLYLQLVVDGDALPRIQVSSTAFALRARRAEGVAEDGVTSESIADGAVGADALADEAVIPRVLAENAVSADAVADGAITSGKLAANAVTTDALVDNAVTSRKLGTSAVDSRVLADGAVRTTDLGNAAVTRQKVAQGTLVTSMNGITDDINLIGGANVTIRENAAFGTITISAENFNGSSSQPSSRRWKTDVQPLDGLDLVQQLRGVRYRWKETGEADVGVIAEEVAMVLPEVVTYASNGQDAEAVNYGKLVSVLIEAVKAQQMAIEEAQDRIRRLETVLEEVEARSVQP